VLGVFGSLGLAHAFLLRAPLSSFVVSNHLMDRELMFDL